MVTIPTSTGRGGGKKPVRDAHMSRFLLGAPGAWSHWGVGRHPLEESMGHTSEVTPFVGPGGAEVSLHPLPLVADCVLLGWVEEPVRQVTER